MGVTPPAYALTHGSRAALQPLPVEGLHLHRLRVGVAKAVDDLSNRRQLRPTKGTLVHAALERLFVLPAEERTLPPRSPPSTRPSTSSGSIPSSIELDARRYGRGRVPRRRRAARPPLLSSRTRPPSRPSASSSSSRRRSAISAAQHHRPSSSSRRRPVVTDYKTGKVPTRTTSRASSVASTHSSASGSSASGRPGAAALPGRAARHHHHPTEQSIRGLERKVSAIWTAVERACTAEDFRPRPSKLCDWCAFQAYCPAFGGDPDSAKAVPVDLVASAG